MCLQCGLYIVGHTNVFKTAINPCIPCDVKTWDAIIIVVRFCPDGIWSQYILVTIQLPISSDISFLSHTLNIYIYLVGKPIMDHVNWWDSLFCIRWTFHYRLCSSLGLLILTKFYRKKYFWNCKISHDIITTGFTYRLSPILCTSIARYIFLLDMPLF